MTQKSKASLFFLTAFFLATAVFGYLKATGGDKTPNSPKIEITPLSYDFGNVDFGKTLNYVFLVKNSGKETLEIKRVATSCGCTTAKVAKEKISPGEEVELMVAYDTKAMGEGPHGKGKQERIIYVKSNDPANPQIEVMIYAYVR